MLEYWLWLTGRRGVGLRGLRALLEQFGTPEENAPAVIRECEEELAKRSGGELENGAEERAPAGPVLTAEDYIWNRSPDWFPAWRRCRRRCYISLSG